MDWKRFTPFFLLAPWRYIERSSFWRQKDLAAFSERFEWRRDPYGGRCDFVRNAEETWVTGRGDCEDYALVVCNVLASRQHRPVRLVVCGSGWMPIPEHVAVFDGENVYSSGEIYEETTVSEYVEQSEYDWAVQRPILTNG